MHRTAHSAVVAVIAACLLISLGGCAPVPAASTSSRALATITAAKSTPVVIDGVEVSWSTRGESILVSLWGNSCPPVLSSVAVNSDKELHVRFEGSQGDALCLEYLRQWSTEVPLPDQVDEVPLAVAITIPSYPNDQTIPGFVLE